LLEFLRNRGTINGYLVRLAWVSVLLSAIAVVSVYLQPGIQYAPAWPATPVGVAILWHYGWRFWPAITVANFLLISLRIDTISIAVIDAVLETIIALGLLAALKYFEVRPDFSRSRDLGWFGVSALAASAIALPVHFIVMPFYPDYQFTVALFAGINYWLSETLSFLIFTPLVTAWRSSKRQYAATQNLLALSLLGLVAAGTAVWLFGDSTGSRLLFVMLPFVVASASTGGIAGAGLASALVAMVLIAIAQQSNPTFTDAVLRSVFTATTALTGYLLAALFSERDRIRRKLEYRARHDALTGLLNRYEFERLLQRVYSNRITRDNALLYLDLDQFKLVNDTCGHIAGDRMLKELAEQLNDAMPEGVRLARLGGDEFGCLLENSNAERAMEVAASLEKVVRDFRFVLGELQFNLGVSIGVTLFPAGLADTPDQALGRADVACYTAKEAGRSRSHLYRPQDESMLNLHAGIQEVSQLQTALEQGRFLLYQQPIARISGPVPEIVGHEILLRIQGHDSSGPMPPGDFLPIAQRYGLIEHIDRWVLTRAAEYLGEHAGEDIRLNVNVSGLSASSAEFFDHVSALPERYGFRPSQLALEITESIAINKLEQVTPSLLRLRRQGFGIVLDDFGAGVASFGYLGDLPVTEVKLDGSFVRDMGKDPVADLVIQSLTRLAALRNLRCVAEWVETEADIERLRGLGVHYGQGYAIARPAPLTELTYDLNVVSVAR
jgi:diguanylate cyclase (GGDEF)-like protein